MRLWPSIYTYVQQVVLVFLWASGGKEWHQNMTGGVVVLTSLWSAKNDQQREEENTVCIQQWWQAKRNSTLRLCMFVPRKTFKALFATNGFRVCVFQPPAGKRGHHTQTGHIYTTTQTICLHVL